MTYDIKKELFTIAENKDGFKFNLKKFKEATLKELETYKETGDVENLANIAINSILLVGANKGFDIIESSIKVTTIRNVIAEMNTLEKVIASIQETLESDIFTKANIRSILRATGSFTELQNKNFRKELSAQIDARLAEMK